MSAPNCTRFEWLLPALCDGDESASAHLAACAECRAQWSECESLLGELAAGEPLGRAPDLRPAVLARVNRMPRARRAFWLPAAIAATLIFAALLTPLGRRTTTSAPSAPLTALTAEDESFADALYAGITGESSTAASEGDLESSLLAGATPDSPEL